MNESRCVRESVAGGHCLRVPMTANQMKFAFRENFSRQRVLFCPSFFRNSQRIIYAFLRFPRESLKSRVELIKNKNLESFDA